MIKGLLISLQFFTSIPVPFQLPMDQHHLKKAVQTFPILGFIQGGIYAAVFYSLQENTPFSELALAFLLWLLTIVLTGGIHLDGWIDASDAYFSFRDKDKRLEIMKDPRTGAFGVISVIVLLAAKFLFIYEIIQQSITYSFFLIMLIPVLGKSLMGYFLSGIRSAKKDGLAYFFQQAAPPGSLWIYPVYMFIFLAVAWSISAQLLVFSSVMVLASAAAALWGKHKMMKWFGGVTGDVLGAAVEGMELVLWATLWLLHYFAIG